MSHLHEIIMFALVTLGFTLASLEYWRMRKWGWFAVAALAAVVGIGGVIYLLSGPA